MLTHMLTLRVYYRKKKKIVYSEPSRKPLIYPKESRRSPYRELVFILVE